jgi:hypothetical protein
MTHRTSLAAGTVLALLAGFCTLPAADTPAKDGVLVLIDSTGKEQKIKAWKFSAGTRHLTWLAPVVEPKDKPAPDPKDKTGKAPVGKAPAVKPRPAIGPEAVEFRDEKSTTYVDGILTLVPLDRVRSLEFDEGTQTVTLKALAADGKEEVLKGTTKYRGINKFTIEAEVDKGDMGIAEIKFLGGLPKGFRAVTFPAPKAPAAPAQTGSTVTFTVNDKQKITQQAQDVQALYRLADGTERLLPTLMFKKTLKVDLTKVKRLHAVESAKPEENEWQVTFKEGEEQTLSLLKTITLDDKPMILEGFLGKVPAGYKLFPPHTVTDIVFDDMRKD